MRFLAAALALVPVLAAAPARADSCLSSADVEFGLGAGTHWKPASSTRAGEFGTDGPGYLVAARFRVACHVAVGARVAGEQELELHIFGDEGTPDPAILDFTPAVTVGTHDGALRAQLSVGPAFYETSGTMPASGIGLGADAAIGATFSEKGYVGGAVATTIDPDRLAVSYLLVLGWYQP